jgi:hypothetical protein
MKKILGGLKVTQEAEDYSSVFKIWSLALGDPLESSGRHKGETIFMGWGLDPEVHVLGA